MERTSTLDVEHLRRLAEAALEEDRAWEDITTAALVTSEQTGRGVILAKAEGVVAGLPVAETVFKVLDPTLRWQGLVEDGAAVSPGQELATLEGALASILRGERVALNFLQRLSGIATATVRMVQAVEGLPVVILDTRKTTPGLRELEKYAVRMGGGTNHRLHLADGVLVKDNHLAALRARDLAIADAVRLARASADASMVVEVEVTTVAEAEEALAAGADMLLLDNMDPPTMLQVAQLARGRAKLEASGGITMASVHEVAETGVDYISSGALTHSVRALDISLELELA